MLLLGSFLQRNASIFLEECVIRDTDNQSTDTVWKKKWVDKKKCGKYVFLFLLKIKSVLL